MSYESQAFKLAEATLIMASVSTSLSATINQAESNEEIDALVGLLQKLERDVADLKDAISLLKQALFAMHTGADAEAGAEPS